jgi:hypothetical protein
LAEISNWSGKALAAPRTELDALLSRGECGNPGVYVLTGTDPSTNAEWRTESGTTLKELDQSD